MWSQVECIRGPEGVGIFIMDELFTSPYFFVNFFDINKNVRLLWLSPELSCSSTDKSVLSSIRDASGVVVTSLPVTSFNFFNFRSSQFPFLSWNFKGNCCQYLKNLYLPPLFCKGGLKISLFILLIITLTNWQHVKHFQKLSIFNFIFVIIFTSA